MLFLDGMLTQGWAKRNARDDERLALVLEDGFGTLAIRINKTDDLESGAKLVLYSDGVGQGQKRKRRERLGMMKGGRAPRRKEWFQGPVQGKL